MTQLIALDTVSHYLSFLDNSEEVFCYSLMDARSNEVLKGHGVRFGTSDELLELLPRIKKEFSLHVTLNSMKIGGRRKKDVERVRVLCVDIDSPKESEEIKALVSEHKPQLVVESSPKKYHMYWKVESSMPFEMWERWQRLLNFKIGGDLSLAVLTHTIRVPGIERICKDGTKYIPRIVFDKGERDNFNRLKLEELFPKWAEWLEEAEVFVEKQKKNRKLLAKQYLSGKSTARLIANADSLGGRNSTLYSLVKSVCISKKIESEVEALSIGEEFNNKFRLEHKSGALEQSEVEKTVNSAFNSAREVVQAMAERDLKAFDAASFDSVAMINVKLMNKEKKEMEETIAPEQSLNGHHAAPVPFLYDFEADELKISKYSETALIERVLQRFRSSLLRVKGRFYAFNSTTYEWILQNNEQSAEISGFVKRCINDLLNEEGFIERFGKTQKGELSLEKLQNNIDRFKAVKLLQSIPKAIINTPEVPIQTNDIFDSKTDWVLCANGALDLKTGTLRRPKDTDYFLGNCGIKYDEDALCTNWLDFLNEVFIKNPETPALIDFMQEVFGYSLSGEIEEKKVFCHYGDGANGKSKILQALLLISGPNGTIIDPDELVNSKGKFSRAFERFGAKIEGHRVAILDDMEVGDSWNDSNLKNITEPQCRARAENQRSRVFANRCKVHVAANMIPRAAQETEALTRRLCIIHYLRRFEVSASAEKTISKMIQNEAPGIFNWAVKGYQRMKEREGIQYLDAQRASIAEYRESVYSIEAALKAFYEPGGPEDFIFTSEILEDVRDALKEQGEVPVGLNAIKIGMAIHREFGIKAENRWNKEKNMPLKGVTLKRKYAKKDATSIF